MPFPPRATRRSRDESAQVIVLVLIVLAVLAGGWWMLRSNKNLREREAFAFAKDAADHIVLRQDMRFLDFNMTQEAKMQYPPSWRLRLMDMIRQPGTPNPQFQVKGTTRFESGYFEPSGVFVAQFDYPTGTGYLELHISHPGALWVIDDLNWTWPPPPTPTPAPMTPTPSPSPTPTPSPTPAPAHSKAKAKAKHG
ncbi:MAG: hypothetical protein M3Y86_05010 [Verrucomicrobiota bacterium]|nr:hypothetical protein [Verrucomicrobiota bacterium]